MGLKRFFNISQESIRAMN